MLGLRVTRQGDWWIEGVNLLARSRAHRVWYVNTEQKRPRTFTAYETFDAGRRVDRIELYIGSGEDSLHFRPGATGSQATAVAVDLPRCGRRECWQVYVEDDKWGLFVVAVRERRLGHWRIGRRWWASGPSTSEAG
jgi:hypothetical protein